MVNVRIPPGANCLLATKLQTDSTDESLESVIHIGYDALTITTIHPKDSLLWKVFSYRGFFVIESFIVLNSIPWLSFIVAIQYGQVFQSLSSREPKMEEGVLGTFRFCSLSLPSRNTLHTDQVALTIHLKLHPTIVNAPILLIVV